MHPPVLVKFLNTYKLTVDGNTSGFMRPVRSEMLETLATQAPAPD